MGVPLFVGKVTPGLSTLPGRFVTVGFPSGKDVGCQRRLSLRIRWVHCLGVNPRVLAFLFWLLALLNVSAQPLPRTVPLTGSNDLAMDMVGGISRYLDRETALAVTNRAPLWRTDLANSTPPGFIHRFDSNRARLRQKLGLTDTREPVTLRHVAPIGVKQSPGSVEVARGSGYRVFAVAWNVFRGVEGEGLLLQPDGEPKGDVIALPDCDWTPEQLVGLAPGLRPAEQFARLAAEQGCRVLVPCLIDRSDTFGGNPDYRSMKHSQRETLWRAGWEMGRTPIAYELQKIYAAADWLEQTRRPGTASWNIDELLAVQQRAATNLQFLGIIGQGEGGLMAYYAAACDTRFSSTYVSGYFGPRENLWEEPIYRNASGLLREFGDAEIGSLIAPRWLWIETGRYPDVTHTDAGGGAPGRIQRPEDNAVTREFDRLQKLSGSVPTGHGHSPPDTFGAYVSRFLFALTGTNPGVGLQPGTAPTLTGALPDAKARTLRQYRQILEDTQWLMRESPETRRAFWKNANVKTLSGFTNSAAAYRDHFRSNIIGIIPPASLPPNPRTRFLGETNGVRRYEVVLDVHPDVFAHGILCVPGNVQPGERRPVVVCQHGLEGRPTDVSDPAVNSPYYHQYGLRLAERGFVTFAPQNPYIGKTRFRQVLHQAQPLGLTLWSFIVRQHEVITDWLAAQDFVDPARIAFYGLSYGGKTAMRVPVLVDRYCLSICSADYNEWIWKNTSARSGYSYLFNSEYDMPEWNLGNTFNYAEMSWLIFPRPFMVERGHDDGVAPDEWVAYEYAKTRRHYVKMGLSDRTEIEFFDGPHSIHGVGTFDFLHRHLKWPKPEK